MAKGKKDCLRRQIIKELCWESGRIRITLSRSGLMEHNSEDSKLSVCIYRFVNFRILFKKEKRQSLTWQQNKRQKRCFNIADPPNKNMFIINIKKAPWADLAPVPSVVEIVQTTAWNWK